MKKYTFYIGLDNSHVDPAFRRHYAAGAAVKSALAMAAVRFGGATVIETKGAYRAPSGEIIFEQSLVVETFVPANAPVEPDVNLFVGWAKAEFQQREILVRWEAVEARFA